MTDEIKEIFKKIKSNSVLFKGDYHTPSMKPFRTIPEEVLNNAESSIQKEFDEQAKQIFVDIEKLPRVYDMDDYCPPRAIGIDIKAIQELKNKWLK